MIDKTDPATVIKVTTNFLEGVKEVTGDDTLAKGQELYNHSYGETPPLTVMTTLLDVLALRQADDGDSTFSDAAILGIAIMLANALNDVETTV
jgi:hypothetical protein